MKKKNGFTLVELLAVLIILSILLLISVPIVKKMIENSRKDAFLDSVEILIRTTDMDIVNKAYETEYRYNVINGIISELEISAKNTEGMNGIIIYDEVGNGKYAIHNEKYCVKKTDEMKNADISNYVEGKCSPFQIYENGQIVYFDVVKGTGCTMEEYASSYDSTISDYQNSLTGYKGLSEADGQNGCLLFYAFNDDGGETVDLILDHNTTDKSSWFDRNNSSVNGPQQTLSDLMSATYFWQGTITPEDYVVKQIVTESDGTETIYGNYKIQYEFSSVEPYKARLITANDIAKITGADIHLNWDESINSKGFYFENLTESSSLVCTDNNDATICKYGWLYDRTSTTCKNDGCYNNADATVYGYWTGTSTFGTSGCAWSVGSIGNLGVTGRFEERGTRPVITVSKSKISFGLAPIHP